MTELPNVRDVTQEFKVGEMAIGVIEDNLFKWCMILEVKSDGLSCKSSYEYIN